MLRLVANLSTPFRGIHGTYNFTNCGGRIMANLNVNITSPGYPNNYPTRMDCQWVIVSDDGEIQITFTDLRLENDCNKDYVLVRNGHHINSPIVGKFCGTHIPAPVVASSGYLVVIFHSDEYGTAPGFSLTTGEVQRGCGGLIHLTSGTISSQNYPSRYDNNLECVWVIEYVPGYIVHLEFVGRFELEMDSNCEKDYILIEEFEDDNTWSVKEKKCGSSTPEPMTLKSRKARLTFRSNDRITGDGFKLKYSTVCGGNFTQSSGEIFSPHYPNSYDDHLSCTYTIGKEGQYVSLIFDENFSLEAQDDCIFDNISIAHGNDANFTQGPYCGNQAPAPRSLSGPVVIKFITDSTYAANGFKVNYQIFDCGAVLREPSGAISTPRNAQEYLHWIDCTWQIVAQPNRVIAVRFKQLDIGTSFKCWSEYLEIRDGNTTGPLIGRVCGKNSTVSVKSLGNMLTMKLHMKPESGGISGHYYNTFGPDQGCGGTINAASGSIQSFDADNNGLYEPNLDCNWFAISDNPEKVLQITFERFDLFGSEDGSCEFDYLELREQHAFGNLIGKFCGSNLPTAIVTSTHKVNILFHTDGESNGPGFKLNFNSIYSPCGPSSLQSETESQFLMSPNYPSLYPANIHCKWMLIRNGSNIPSMDLGRSRMKIHIKFIDFDIPCGGDYLNLHQKESRSRGFSSGRQNSLSDLRMCGSQNSEFDSPTGMQLFFHSDSIPNQARGFKLSYENSVCSRNYTSDAGVIANPVYPSMINPETFCNISIVTTVGKTISLYIYRLDIMTCNRHFFKVYDGSNNSAPLLLNRCNNMDGPTALFSTGNSLFIEVNMQDHVAIYYMNYMTTDHSRGCGGSIIAEQGVVSSPLYPQPYNSTSECVWYIAVPGYHTVGLTFVRFNLTSTTACTINYLEIYDGQTGDMSERVARYCGSDVPAGHSSRSNGVMIKLVTDTSNVGSGFLIHFKSNAYFPSSLTPLIQREDGEDDEETSYVIPSS